MRKVGRYGRLKASRAKAIVFRQIFSGTIPDHPPYVDYLAEPGGQWQMLGNDRAGDCVSVTWANFRRLVTAVLAGKESYPSLDQVWQFYRTQNSSFDPSGSYATNGPGSSSDNGMVIQLALDELHRNGGPDGTKLVAFARVNLRDPEEVKAAIATCGALWTGIDVSPNNEDEFSNGEPWDYQASSQPVGGHSVLTGGYGTTVNLSRKLGGDEKFITWAQETSFTDSYWANRTEEAYACIWPEHLGTRAFEQGISGEKLAEAYEQVTGSSLVLP